MRQILILVLAIGLLSLLSCGPKKVVLSNRYLSSSKTVKTLMLPSSKAAKDTKLFHYFIRVCDLDEMGKETNCQDTLVLENVNPASLY